MRFRFTPYAGLKRMYNSSPAFLLQHVGKCARAWKFFLELLFNGRIDASRFMEATFKQIEVQAGHFMHLEVPNEVNTAISNWIQSN